MATTIHDDLRDAYEAIPYVGRPNHYSEPGRLAAIAKLHGLPVPPRDTLSMLEIGCGDGSNLLPIAAAHPGGRFVGIDLSTRLVASAREMAGALGLANVTMLEADVRALRDDLDRFDVVVAHGFYSWVPPDVRDAMFDAMRAHLAPQGIAYVSYNLLPGAWIRRVGWDAMRFHIRDEADPARRVALAREAIGTLVEAWAAQKGPAAMMAESFAQEHVRTDGGYYHDNLSLVNEPVYYSVFTQHAARRGLAVFADADPATLSTGGASDAYRARLSAQPALVRDQMLDFVHARALRQSLLAAPAVAANARLDLAHAPSLHFSATMALMQQRGTGQAPASRAVDLLAERFPTSVPFDALARALRSSGADAAPRIFELCIAGAADLHVAPLAIATRPTVRPRASAVARWQAQRRTFVANLRHVGVRLADDCARALLPLCDGKRSAAELAIALVGAVPAVEARDPRAAVERRLAQFASAALLEA
ncbi:MAG: class I SAM-dependent methyltransferase [Betaproteobacteria bacterium]